MMQNTENNVTMCCQASMIWAERMPSRQWRQPGSSSHGSGPRRPPDLLSGPARARPHAFDGGGGRRGGKHSRRESIGTWSGSVHGLPYDEHEVDRLEGSARRKIQRAPEPPRWSTLLAQRRSLRGGAPGAIFFNSQLSHKRNKV